MKELRERAHGKSVRIPAMEGSLAVISIFPLLTLSSATSWGYRDSNSVDHAAFHSTF